MKIYTVHPEMLTVYANYNVPINDYDIESFSIDRGEYKLPAVPKQLEDTAFTELFEKCTNERIHRYLYGY